MNREFELLAKKAMRGHKKAVEELLTRLGPLVSVYSRRYGGCRDEKDEDAYQEGMLVILEGLKHYEVSRNIPFLGYITTRMRHCYQNRRRKLKQHYSLQERVGDEDSTVTLGDLVADEKVNVEEEYSRRDRVQQLQKAIRGLTSSQQHIIVAYYFDEKTLKEIAQERNIHPITVAKIKATALKNLRKILAKGNMLL